MSSRSVGGDQHIRLSNEPRLDAGLDWDASAPLWMYGLNRPAQWLQEASYAELSRWCFTEWNDGKTDEIAEARYRKAARPSQPMSLETVLRHDNDGEPVTAGDQAGFENWQREQRESEAPQRLDGWRWLWFWTSLSEPEQVTLRLLAGELPNGDYLRSGRAGRTVAHMLGCTENMIRKRRLNATQKLWNSGMPYVLRGRSDHGPAWCARRVAPSVRVRIAPIHREGNVIPLPSFSRPTETFYTTGG